MPWFTMGKLSPEDHAYFQDCLNKHPQLQQLLDHEQEMKRLILQDKTLLELSALEPIDERLKKVMNQIDSVPQNKTEKYEVNLGFVSKLKESLISWFPGKLNIWHYSSFASAAILVAVLMAFIAPIFNQGKFTDETEFTPASANDTELNNSASTTILLVGFNGSPEELRTQPALKDKLTNVEAVPTKKNMYRVSLNSKLNADEVKQILDTLLSEKEHIWFAGEAF